MSFTTSVKGNTLFIDLGKSFRNDVFAEEFGPIQQIIENNFSIFDIEVNLHKCEWADPIPLLSLIILLSEFKKRGGRSRIRISDVAKPNKDTDKVVRFLYEEGFLNQFSNCSTVFDSSGFIKDHENQDDQKLERIQNIQSALYYSNGSMLTAEILDTKSLFSESELEKVDFWVEERIKIMSALISDKIPQYSQNSILHRLTLVLVEMIQNVVKHAYRETNQSYAGVYVRYRNGLDNNSLSSEERKKLNYALRDEDKSCPRLDREYLDLKKGCIEIFVVDLGIGFTNTLREILPNPNVKYVFREAHKKVFHDGMRRKYSEKPDSTFQGGLFYIGEMIKEYQDYLCGRDANEWVGGLIPIISDNAYASIDPPSGQQVRGLSWIVRLSWNNELEMNSDYWSSWDGSAIRHPAYFELATSTHKISLNQHPVFDFRFLDHKQVLPNSGTSPNSDNICLLLPSINQTKLSLWNLIEIVAQKFEEADNRTLIIGDIPEYERKIFTAVLHKIYFSKSKKTVKWITKFSKIILISRRLSVSILNRVSEENSLTYITTNENDRLEYIENHLNDFAPSKSLAHYFIWLRAFDSRLIWVNFSLNGGQKNFFVNSKVVWNNELDIIEGYLDFAQTCTDSLNLKLYKLALERTIGFFKTDPNEKSKYCVFQNIDILTKRLIDESNSTLFYESQKGNDNLIYVGSVFASGKSREEAMFLIDQTRPLPTVHIFQHPSSKIKSAHLFSWPDKKWLDNHFPKRDTVYKRIGRTHVISKNGYKDFTIPRYDTKTNKSVYYRRPRLTYKDWQNEKNQVISFGHFELDGKHDLFKISVVKLITESFLFNNELSQFLVSEFFISLGGFSKTQLTESGQKFMPIIDQRRFEENIQEVALIAYPNNSGSALVVDKIKSFFLDEMNDKIFPLMPVNKERNGSSLLISPLMFDSLKEAIANSENKEVLLFDSSVISGRTRKELKHLLISLGAKDVRTLSITDRFRLPFRAPNPQRHKSYWRLDVPRLGTADVCFLCKSLHSVELFKNNLASAYAIERIEQWNEKWKAISFFNVQSDHGIKPTPIAPIEKKFGLVQNPDTGEFEQIMNIDDALIHKKNEIELKNSTGLSLYATELHSMTSRDDLALRLANEVPDISAPATIELISSQLLLFPNEYPKNVHFAMVEKLFKACSLIKLPDNYSALAALVIIIQERAIHQKLLESLKREGYSDIANTNFDLEIALAYIYYNVQSENVESEKILRLLKFKGEETIASLYRLFHFELYNEYGKIHRKPLIALYEKNDISPAEKLKNAINSVSKLLYLLSKIQNYLYCTLPHVEIEPIQHKEKMKASLTEFYNSFRNIIVSYIMMGKEIGESENYLKEYELIKSNVEEFLISGLKQLHEFLFCPVLDKTDSNNQPIKMRIQSQIDSIDPGKWISELSNKYPTDTKIPVVKISKNFASTAHVMKNKRDNAWIILDKLIVEEIYFLICNAVHARGKEIPDIWSVDGNDTEKANLWIRFSYENDFLNLEFVNASENDPKMIKTSILEKDKEGMVHLIEELKGELHVHSFTFNDSSIDEVLVKITLKIPII